MPSEFMRDTPSSEKIGANEGLPDATLTSSPPAIPVDFEKTLNHIIKPLFEAVVNIEKRLATMQEYIDKTLHIASIHYDLYGERSARPYFPLDDKWGLTKLDNGQNFFINTSDRNVAPWIIMGGHWERNVERVMLNFIKPTMTVLDIGAHFGYYTVRLGGKLGTGGRLHSFEPNPEVNAVCEENIKINGLADRAVLHKHALGDIRTRVMLTRSNSNMASANLLGEQDADYSVEVQVERLDDVLGGDVVVDLIKLDAEGYEKKILDGATDVLHRSPNCAVMLELSLDRWEKAAPLDQLIPAVGGGKELYAVREDGTLEHFTLDRLRPFLLTCAFHENYFFLAPAQLVEASLKHLIRL